MKSQNPAYLRMFLPACVTLLAGNAIIAAPTTGVHPDPLHTLLPQKPAKTNAASIQKAIPQKSVATGAFLPDLTPEEGKRFGAMVQAQSQSAALVKQADAAAQLGQWPQASAEYQEALNLWPRNPDGLYGLGQCAASRGDLPHAISYYRTVIYTSDPFRYGTVPGDGFQENNVKRLMQFSLLLSRAGQLTEGIFIYNRAVSLLNYEGGNPNGKQTVKVLLPELVLKGSLPGQVLYTPEHLQAFADTALAHEEMSFGNDDKALAHMQEAVKLYPDSAVAQYYLGEAIPYADVVAAKVAYSRAAQFGDEPTITAAKERLAQYP